jgi:hypothetical protein
LAIAEWGAESAQSASFGAAPGYLAEISAQACVAAFRILFSAVATPTTVTVAQIELAFADDRKGFMLSFISNWHPEQIRGDLIVRNWDGGPMRAVAGTRLLGPSPKFAIFGVFLCADDGVMIDLSKGAQKRPRGHPAFR